MLTKEKDVLDIVRTIGLRERGLTERERKKKMSSSMTTATRLSIEERERKMN